MIPLLSPDIDMVNTAKGKAPYDVTISPDRCCLEIAQNDIDCDVSSRRSTLLQIDVTLPPLCLCHSRCSCDLRRHFSWDRLTDMTTRVAVSLSSFETWYYVVASGLVLAPFLLPLTIKHGATTNPTIGYSYIHTDIHVILEYFPSLLQYCRFRKGNCTFIISAKGKSPTSWKHTIVFNTYPPEDDEGDTKPFLCV